MFYKKLIVLLLVITSLVLVGCNNKLYKQTESNIAEAAERSFEARHKSDTDAKAEPTLIVKQDAYVDRTPISINQQPGWLRSHIVVRGEDLPFSYYSRLIVNGGQNVLTRYQVGLDPNIKISMNYTGDVKGALDLLATKAGYVYEIRGHNVYWQAFVTKTFDIAFMPGSSDYMMGKVGSSSTSGSSVSAVGVGTGTTANAIIDDSAAAQYSNLKGTLSVWKDLENTIHELMSPDGRVIVSEATTSVTVRDKPTNVALISKFIGNLNSTLSKQVLVKVQVLEVNLSSDFNYGINWNLVQRSFGGGGSNFILNANEGQPVSITPLGLGTTLSQFGLQPSKKDASTGFTILVNALTQQGKVSVVSEPRVVCLNNQVSSLRIVSQTGYLASVQNTTVAGTSGGTSGSTLGTVTTQITPGTLVTGLTLYILPKILGNKIFLQVNADISSSQGIRTISSTTGTTPNLTANPNPSSNIIQVPDVTQKQFNQRSVIGSGDTLILSGFRQVSNTANAMQLFDSQALGGKGAQQSNKETVILITPTILHGTA